MNINNISLNPPCGPIVGYKDEKYKVNCFLGVPFAEAPVGDLKFRHAIPRKKWTEPLECKNIGPDPAQYPYGSQCGEDCLKLNVYVPDNGNENKAVMVWIYGGSYVHGGCAPSFKHGSRGMYDARLLSSEQDVIIVTINYRMGCEGFLYLKSLSDRFDINNGLSDCVEALRWVRDNIDSFGGDKNNVTVWGQSAGAALALALRCTPDAKGLFHKCISQSCCFESFYTPKQGEVIAKQWLNILGAKADDLLSMSACDYVTPIKQIDKIVRSKYFGICSVNPVVDGEYLTEFPSKSKFDDGIPTLIGSNLNEAWIFSPLMNGLDGEEVLSRIFPYIDIEERNRILSRYSDNPKTKDYCSIAGDIMYSVTKHRAALAISKTAKVWVYRSDFAPCLTTLMGWNACHGTEMPLLFGNMTPWFYMPFYIGCSSTAKAIGRRMRDRWCSFAKTGNPNNTQTQYDIKWPEYNSDSRSFIVFDKKDKTESAVRNGDNESYDSHMLETYGDKTDFFL